MSNKNMITDINGGTDADRISLELQKALKVDEIVELGSSGVKVDTYNIGDLAEAQTVQMLVTAADDANANDTWERIIFIAPRAIEILSVGVVATTAFGQVTNFATLAFTDKGAAGAGTDVIATKDFDAAITALDQVDFGAVSNATLAAGETVTLKKTVTASGEVVTAYMIAYIIFKTI